MSERRLFRRRALWVAGNWKMNGTRAETQTFFDALKTSFPKSDLPAALHTAIFVSPLSIDRALTVRGDLPVEIGLQNVHFETKGAFTGEISGPMALEAGIKLALVGHSERRQYFGETDATAKRRTESLLAQGFTVIHCIGETKTERLENQTETVLARQIDDGLPTEYSDRLIIAYEPVWAIGTGLTATPEQAEEAHAFIRTRLATRYNRDAAEKLPILYGGSVTPDVFPALLALPNVDGGLVGGASLKAESFRQLIQQGLEVTRSP